LIEIVAVLVILGMLAVVALPQYYDMLSRSQQNTVLGAVAALESVANLEYAKTLLTTPSVTTYTLTSPVVVGDFSGTEVIAAGFVTETVTAGPA